MPSPEDLDFAARLLAQVSLPEDVFGRMRRGELTAAEAVAFVGAQLEPWDVESGARVLWDVRDVALAHGHLLALYGSTLSGRGRDLDVLAVPFTARDPRRGYGPPSSGAALLDALSTRWGRGLRTLVDGSPGSLYLIGRRIIDVVVSPGPRHAASV
jgi:hypothetical protein